jgi:hypothetical protein
MRRRTADGASPPDSSRPIPLITVHGAALEHIDPRNPSEGTRAPRPEPRNAVVLRQLGAHLAPRSATWYRRGGEGGGWRGASVATCARDIGERVVLLVVASTRHRRRCDHGRWCRGERGRWYICRRVCVQE